MGVNDTCLRLLPDSAVWPTIASRMQQTIKNILYTNQCEIKRNTLMDVKLPKFTTELFMLKMSITCQTDLPLPVCPVSRNFGSGESSV